MELLGTSEAESCCTCSAKNRRPQTWIVICKSKLPSEMEAEAALRAEQDCGDGGALLLMGGRIKSRARTY